eukprot:scaffold117569_cov30-Tisochrysis_lutea.AAC.1
MAALRPLLLLASLVLAEAANVCLDTCSSWSDGSCDDGGQGSEFALCPLGTDCVDCGFRQVPDPPSSPPFPPSSPPFPPPSSPAQSSHPPYTRVFLWTGIVAAVLYAVRWLHDTFIPGSPPSPAPPISSPPQPISPPSQPPPSPPSLPCIGSLAEGRTIRNGPIGNQWCYNVGISPSVVGTQADREKCEGAYLDPATALSTPSNSYPYDCSGGCKLC